jgi:3-phenylpropionate/cinnamic acid dioxygenase small subunit
VNQAEEDALIALVQLAERSREGLEAKVQLLEDKAAIRDLIMRYGFLCDARRWDDLLELYVDDIERVLGGTLDERVRGKAELKKLLEAPVLPRRPSDGQSRTRMVTGAGATWSARHLMSSDVIRVSDGGTEASASVQYTLVVTSVEGDQFDGGSHEGAYIFSFRKVDEIWKFSKQIVIANTAFNPMFSQAALT